MDAFFLWLEATRLSVWVRESTSVLAFPAILSLHAVGMGLAVGVNVAIALRLFGVASGVPPRELNRFAPFEPNPDPLDVTRNLWPLRAGGN